jgi:hypothetical protein
VVLALLVSGLFAASVLAPPFKFKTGLITNNEPLVEPGYVLYSGRDGIVYLVAQNGQLVRRWQAPIADHAFGHPIGLENGNILGRLSEDGPGGTVVEMDQGGNLVWSFDPPDGFAFHHDHQRLENGNTLILCAVDVVVPSISPDTLEDDCLLEVSPEGEIVWEWHTWEHFDDFGFSDEIKAMISDHAGDWAHANSAQEIPSDTNHLDPRFKPGNIIISYRFINQVVVVDRDSGDIVWKSDGLTLGQHDAHMLPNSLPGGGNILIFDNGLGGHYNIGGREIWSANSRIAEVNPKTNEVVWEYDATMSGLPAWFFDSFFISSVQRLPNGNTLINEGAFGHFFEVTPDGEIVWDYVNRAEGLQGAVLTNRVYRAKKVPLDWLE